MSNFSATLTATAGDAYAPSRLHPSDVADRISVMRAQEEHVTYRCRDYFNDVDDKRALQAVDETMPHHGQSSSFHAQSSAAAGGPQHRAQQQQQQRAQQSSDKPPVDAECRTKMVEWCSQVIDFCKFSRETVGIGMSYLDRYVASGARRARQALIDRKEYQLASMTCLYMAIKLNEPLEMETKLLSDLSRGCYDESEIAAMEREILQALEWRLAGPTPLQFVQHFIAVGLHGMAAAANPAIEATLLDFSKFQTELAMGLPSLVPVSPSKVALSAVLNSMEAIDSDTLDPFERTAFLESIVSASNLDVASVEVMQVRSLLMDSFFKNSGFDLRQVASRLTLGRKKNVSPGKSTKTGQTSSGSSSPEVSPVCVSGKMVSPTRPGIAAKKQRCG